MKFIVSSSKLLSHLSAVSKVISSKNTLPILDNFLFEIKSDGITITASDLETTLITNLDLENIDGTGIVAIEAKRLTDILREFPEQPLTFEINEENQNVDILTENGKFSIMGQTADDFPNVQAIDDDAKSEVKLSASTLLAGISKTLFATADDELRPVMNGIFFELKTDSLTFVASDAHKLVRYRRLDVTSENESNFILPKKPASLLKNILAKEQNDIFIEFDAKNASFSLPNYKMICRLVEGKYPSYESVIPMNNPNKVTIDRVDLLNTARRVSVFSNQASNLVKLHLTENKVTLTAQDIDFSISAYEHLNCQYDGDPMEIGFKSAFMQEILHNLSAADVVLEMSDPSRAGIFVPADKEEDNVEELMLLMPMMINS